MRCERVSSLYLRLTFSTIHIQSQCSLSEQKVGCPQNMSLSLITQGWGPLSSWGVLFVDLVMSELYCMLLLCCGGASVVDRFLWVLGAHWPHWVRGSVLCLFGHFFLVWVIFRLFFAHYVQLIEGSVSYFCSFLVLFDLFCVFCVFLVIFHLLLSHFDHVLYHVVYLLVSLFL